jgi:acyl carrier protein
MPHRYAAVQTWLVDKFAALSMLNPGEIDVERAFVDYQLDSSVAVTLAQQLGKWGGVELQATVFWEYPNIRELALVLAVDGIEQEGNDAT